MAAWTDGYWWSNDGLRLHYRDYAGSPDLLPIVCISGLTRNARDFAAVAERLAGRRRIICVELRGRGESAYAKDPMSYVPLTYLHDLQALLDDQALSRAILFGTSLGGLLSLLISATNPGRIAGVLLNDIGPDLEPAGLGRIRTYVGKSLSWPTWLHAGKALAESQGFAYPNYGLEQWLEMAKRLCRVNNAGRIVFDYDMKIAEPFRLPGGEAGVDLWPTIDALKDIPGLLIRGALSDILSSATAQKMVERLPLLDFIELPDIGHAPTLFEPECIEAIDRLLVRIDAAG